MNRATRWTRVAHRAIGVSVAFALAAAALPLVHGGPPGKPLQLATSDLRSRAEEAALVAQAWDAHRATGSFTRMQAGQLAHAIAKTRREAQDAPAGLAQAAGDVAAAADGLLLALRELETLPAPERASPRAAALTALADRLRAIERALARAE